MSESPKQNYELTGQIKVIKEAQTFGSKGFTKREFVVTIAGKYPQDIALECTGDKCALLDGINEGDEVTARFDIKGREYNGRFYNSLVCWKIESDSQSRQPAPRRDIPQAAKDEGFSAVDDEPTPF